LRGGSAWRALGFEIPVSGSTAMNSSKISVPSVVSSCCMNANGERAGASAARSAGRPAVAAVVAVGAGAPRRTLSPTTAACSVVAKSAILMATWM